MKSKKRARPILVIAPGIISGAEKVVQTGSIALYEIGLDPIVIIIRETRVPVYAEQFEKILPPFVNRIIVNSSSAYDFLLPVRLKYSLKKFLDHEKPSNLVFHSHGFKALIACALVRGQYHHIHTHHGNTGHTLKVRMYEKLAFTFMKSCNRVIAVSQRMKEELLEALAPYKKISVIDNMLSTKNMSKIRERRFALAPNDHEMLKLLYVGRLSPEKGLLNFLQCWSTLIYRDRFELLVLGEGPERFAIEAFLRENHLQSRVKLLGHVMDPAEFYIGADLLIMPSLTEGLPMTLIESLSAGLPVLANDVGAISSLIKHNLNGYLCQNSNPELWTTALWESLKNIQAWKNYAEEHAHEVENRFSPNKWAYKTQAFYQI